MTLLYTFLALFPIALLSPYVVRRKSGWGWVLAGLPAAIFYLLLQYVPEVSHGSVATPSINWLPSLGVSLMFYIDGLSLLFGLIISFIGFLILLYASAYFHHDDYAGRFYMIILLFMGAMLGVVLAGNLFSMFVFWELTSLTSYLLIGWKHDKAESRWSALQALIITGGGGLALLAGIILMNSVVGSYDLPDLLTNAELIKNHTLYLPIFILIALGAFTKSAQFPFHFWLPGAMSAPTPVSAYLHSATMVKAGIYLLARMRPILGGTVEWHTLLPLFGGLTMVLGAAMALPQRDLKKLLAYTTISALGMITMLIGLDTSLAVKAGMVFLLVHSLYKGSLFMVAGAIDHGTGTRDVTVLSGLGRYMPLTMLAAFLAAFSMSGIPPFFGFIGKELVYEAKLHAGSLVALFAIAGVFANAVNVTIAIVVGVRPFLGAKHEKLGHIHQGNIGLWLGPLAAAAAGLILGLFPALVSKPIFTPAVSAVIADDIVVKLKLWHGIGLPLILSVVTLAFGIGMYFMRRRFESVQTIVQKLERFYPSTLFKAGLEHFLALSDRITRLLQNGSLGSYLITIFSVVLSGLWIVVLTSHNFSFTINIRDFNIIDFSIAVLMIIASLAVVKSRSRLASVISLGVVGFGVALIYILHGAADVAITQLIIETLTVVLFVLLLYRLPEFKEFSARPTRIRDGLIATLVGGLMMLLVFIKSSAAKLPNISPFFVENSVKKAHGHNIVNVILVDFRGIDTMGEITVLAVAALGIYALLKLNIRTKED